LVAFLRQSRCPAQQSGSTVRLVSRNNVDHTERFRELAAAIAALKAATLILDGEVCVFDKNLVSRFHLLDRLPDELCTPPVFMAFDYLHVHGLDVRGLPLHRRRNMLEHEVDGVRMIYGVRRLADNGLAAWAVVKERGYEGLVAKDEQSLYRGGPTRSWIKCKIRREGRFVVGGILGLPATFRDASAPAHRSVTSTSPVASPGLSRCCKSRSGVRRRRGVRLQARRRSMARMLTASGLTFNKAR
jgi:hypothetical protein